MVVIIFEDPPFSRDTTVRMVQTVAKVLGWNTDPKKPVEATTDKLNAVISE